MGGITPGGVRGRKDAHRRLVPGARVRIRSGRVHQDVLHFLLGLAVLLGVARILGEVCRRFGFPAVVGEIVSGVALGRTLLGRFAPGAFAWLFPAGEAQTMLSGYTTVAVMLLLVVAGLEIDLTVFDRQAP